MNEPYNEIFQHTFLPEEKRSENVYMSKWLKNDGDFINENEEIFVLRIGEYRGYYYLPTQPIKSSKSGILEIRKANDEIINSNEIIYIVHFDDTYTKKLADIKEQNFKKLAIIEKQKKENQEIERLKSIINRPSIEIDVFTKKKNISWACIGGNISSAIKTRSLDSKIEVYFTFNHINDKNYIVFLTKANHLALSKGDEISFLFDGNRVINFVINENSYKSTNEVDYPSKERILESKVIILNEELNIFQNETFLKWKIHISKNNISQIGGEVYIGDNHLYYSKYQTKDELQMVIKKLATEFKEILSNEIPEFKGIESREIESEINKQNNSEECHVYLMIDISNNFHKIGISNSPKYREFTLQSEKPTIELLASKKFINRKIAKSFESALHSAYINKRMRGEWFQLNEMEISEIIYTLNN